MQHTAFFAGITTLTLTALLSPSARAGINDDWAKLDRDIEALSLSAAQPGGGPTVRGLLRTAYVHLPNTYPGGTQDISATSILNAQVLLEGQVDERYGYRLELEAGGGTAELLDGYGTFQANEHLRLTMGQFRSPIVWESQLDDNDLLFLLRTDVGQLFYTRDDGAMASGALDKIRWAAAIQNGNDNVADDQAYSARLAFDALGGGVGAVQGAYGGGEETQLSVGAGYYNDQSIGSGNDGTVWTGDSQLRVGRLYAGGMISKFGDGSTGFVFTNRTDSTPWALAASWMLVENRWELAARYQDTDNVLNETDLTLGVNYYVAGNNAKWQVNLDQITSDDPDIDNTWRFGLGLTVSI
jgi:hypothetical protein